MPTIALQFPAGRYHATPWGRHVNEGVVEWPPCPWRILRALLATGFSKLGWNTVPDKARLLIHQLAETPPSYRLPHGEIAHTRHYMPYMEGKNQKTTKVIDAFIRLEPSANDLLIYFPVTLAPEQMNQLGQLVTHMSYFGRAESWVVGRLVKDIEPDTSWSQPFSNGSISHLQPGGDQVALLASIPAEQYDLWRHETLQKAIEKSIQETEAAAKLKNKKPTKSQLAKARAKAVKPFPESLLACLLTDTADLQQDGWNQPPSSQRILYNRPPGTLKRRPPHPTPQPYQPAPVHAALFALASDTRRGNVLPLFTRCLPQAELFHQSLISLLGKQMSQCSVLTGCHQSTGQRLVGHRHAHYLPLDLDEDGRIDHMIIHAPMGLDPLAQNVMQRLARTWTKGSDKDIIVTCIGFGDLEQFETNLHLRSGQSLPAFGQARQWSSLTPFVPPRHIKSRKHTLEDQIIAELESRHLPHPKQILLMDHQELVHRKFLRFIRARRTNKVQPSTSRVFGVHLTFENPVSGPISLGYASHYGLGLFTPTS